MKWTRKKAGEYKKNDAGFELRVYKIDGYWYWYTRFDGRVMFYDSGFKNKLRQAKTMASRAMSLAKREFEYNQA